MSTQEQWIPVRMFPPFEDAASCYAVSDDGRVFRYWPLALAREVQRMPGGNGTLKVRIAPTPYASTSVAVHNLVKWSFEPEEQPRRVRHVNGNRADNRLSNLEWAQPAKSPPKRAYRRIKPGVSYWRGVSRVEGRRRMAAALAERRETAASPRD